MRTIVIVGGSKGIGSSLTNNLLEKNKVINISRTLPSFNHNNLTHFSCDFLKNELPEVDQVDSLVYCPGRINLKPISRLSLANFREDFEINVLCAVKIIQKYITGKKWTVHRLLLHD